MNLLNAIKTVRLFKKQEELIPLKTKWSEYCFFGKLSNITNRLLLLPYCNRQLLFAPNFSKRIISHFFI